MNAKSETQSISMEYDLPYPPEKVWRALTEPELLAAWIMVNDIRPLVGHNFTFEHRFGNDIVSLSRRSRSLTQRADWQLVAGGRVSRAGADIW